MERIAERDIKISKGIQHVIEENEVTIPEGIAFFSVLIVRTAKLSQMSKKDLLIFIADTWDIDEEENQ